MTTILIMDLILIAVTVLILIGEKLLLNYGECKITIEQNGKRKELKVQGGRTLLDYLVENKIDISSSCGGKSSCGYCKIKIIKGGGEIFPQEEVFMTREEKRSGMRLACQVRVKEDIEIYIPDFLETIKGMVRNRSYDPAKRWQFRIKNQVYYDVDLKEQYLAPGEKEIIDKIFDEVKNIKGPLMPVLQKSNEAFRYLSEPVLRYISQRLEIPVSVTFRIATFYNAFSLKPKGRYQVDVCLGTACHVKGAADLILALEKGLNLKTGETTKDMRFSLETVRCLGCCGLAPALKINQDVYGLMTRKKAPELVKKYEKTEN
ncbi:MAG: NAD(P)H-dependent oxidoreductase subunit E [bacterium]